MGKIFTSQTSDRGLVSIVYKKMKRKNQTIQKQNENLKVE